MAAPFPDGVGERVEITRRIEHRHQVQGVAAVSTPMRSGRAAGAQVVTLPYKVLCQMVHHPLTDAGIERFVKDWKAAGLS